MSLLITIFFALFFFLFLLFTVAVLYVLTFFLDLFGRKNLSRKLASKIASLWARILLRSCGTKVEVRGLENLPRTNNLCFVSNHQSHIDILLILGFIPKGMGFIAKVELLKVPLLNLGMKKINCIFLDRKNIRQAVTAINRGADNIKAGIPMVIFPEGKRSKERKMNKFLPGSLKMALLSGAVIVPLTVDGTYKVLEEKYRINPSTVRLTIHPAIDTAELSPEEKKKLHHTLWETIASPLGQNKATETSSREGTARSPEKL
ncbi:MAG: 1-acyl-sn-glycerol-3-phosphate acyltransferase [Firmicutes bacterium]|nr:1-acyl-sn-glycerol-3-phosphate acyltransferase [Bacillota bacterium]